MLERTEERMLLNDLMQTDTGHNKQCHLLYCKVKIQKREYEYDMSEIEMRRFYLFFKLLFYRISDVLFL